MEKKVRVTDNRWVYVENGKEVVAFEKVSDMINWLRARGKDVTIGEVEVV